MTNLALQSGEEVGIFLCLFVVSWNMQQILAMIILFFLIFLLVLVVSMLVAFLPYFLEKEP